MECVEESDSDENTLLSKLENWIKGMRSIASRQDSFDSLAPVVGISQDSFASMTQEEVARVIDTILQTATKASTLKALKTVCNATMILLDNSERYSTKNLHCN